MDGPQCCSNTKPPAGSNPCHQSIYCMVPARTAHYYILTHCIPCHPTSHAQAHANSKQQTRRCGGRIGRPAYEKRGRTWKPGVFEPHGGSALPYHLTLLLLDSCIGTFDWKDEGGWLEWAIGACGPKDFLVTCPAHARLPRCLPGLGWAVRRNQIPARPCFSFPSLPLPSRKLQALKHSGTFPWSVKVNTVAVSGQRGIVPDVFYVIQMPCGMRTRNVSSKCKQ
jgi:hypothetical protein